MKYQKVWCTAAALLLACVASKLVAQNDPLPQQIVVTYSSGQSIMVPINDGISTLVGLQPDQIVQVMVKYSPAQAAQIVNLEALDGGSVLPPSQIPPTYLQNLPSTPALPLLISIDGTLTFTFIAGHTVGLNQVSLVGGNQEVGLQFWVLNMQNPQLNPPAATADNPNY